MNLKKALCLVVAVVLVIAVAALGMNANDLKAQLETVNAQIAEKDAAAADLQAQLDAANAQVAELEAQAAAEAETAETETVEAETEAVEAETEADAGMQAELDAANARIAELEAEIADVYMPVYESQIAATYGEDGIIWAKDAAAELKEVTAMYESYGIPIAGMEDMVKESVLDSMLQKAILLSKAAELGLSPLTEEETAAMEAEADAMYDYYFQGYMSYFSEQGLPAEQAEAEVTAYLESSGMTRDLMLASLTENMAAEKLYDYVVADVSITPEEVQAAYEAKVAEQIEDYADNDAAYNNDRNNNQTIAWNPEGYRAVKQALVKFSDEQATLYTELNSTLISLNDELAALDAPAEETSEVLTEGEEVAEPRAREEIQADIDGINAEIEALYAEIEPEAQQIVEKFNAGTSFEDIMAEHNDDPGMTQEPIATIGYAVADKQGTWDPAFVAGAMSIAEVGQISQPIRGSYGIYVIYYMADITPGAVPFEEIAEKIEADALDEKINKTYNDQVEAWTEEAAPVYHTDRF